jgi:hypothetical protein
MKNQLTESQLETATHALAETLRNMGVFLGPEILDNLSDSLNSFLYENASVNIVSDEEGRDESKVQVCKTSNVSCSAGQEVIYEIDKATWKSALIEHDEDAVQALLHLQAEKQVVRLGFESEIKDINAEFDVSVEEV